MSARLDAVLAQIDAQADASLAKLDQAERFAVQTEALAVEGEGGNGAATVVVNATGHPTAVRFGPDFDRLSAAELGSAVMEALAQARRRLSFRVEEIGTEVYGPESPTARMYVDAYREQHGYEEIA